MSRFAHRKLLKPKEESTRWIWVWRSIEGLQSSLIIRGTGQSSFYWTVAVIEVVSCKISPVRREYGDRLAHQKTICGTEASVPVRNDSTLIWGLIGRRSLVGVLLPGQLLCKGMCKEGKAKETRLDLQDSFCIHWLADKHQSSPGVIGPRKALRL